MRWLDEINAAQALGVTVHGFRHMVRRVKPRVKRVSTWRGKRRLFDVDDMVNKVLPRGAHAAECECHRCLPRMTVHQRVMMHSDMQTRLRVCARRQRLTVPEVIRTAIELYLEET